MKFKFWSLVFLMNVGWSFFSLCMEEKEKCNGEDKAKKDLCVVPDTKFLKPSMKHVEYRWEEPPVGPYYSYVNSILAQATCIYGKFENLTAESNIRCFYFSDDGNYLVAGLSDGSIKIWNTQTLDSIKCEKQHTDVIDQIEFVPQDTAFVASSRDKSVTTWNARTGECMSKVNHTDVVQNLKCSPREFSYVTATADKKLQRWDLQGNCLGQIGESETEFQALDYSPSGKFLIAATGPKILVYEDNQLLKELMLPKPHNATEPESIEMLRYAPDEKSFAAISKYGNIQLWDETFKCHNLNKESYYGYSCSSLDFSSDGKELITCLNNTMVGGKICIWDVTEKQPKKDIASDDADYKVQWCSRTKNFLTVTQDSVRLFNANKGICKQYRPLDTQYGPLFLNRRMEFSQPKKLIAALENDRSIVLYEKPKKWQKKNLD